MASKRFVHNAVTAGTTTTTATATSKPYFRYLSAWFCPYAHRATLALEHHASRIDYEWVEALGWEQRNSNNDNDNDNKTEKEWWYHWKADELKRANPSALVPTLIPLVPDNNNENNNTPSSFIPLESKAIYESLITIEFIDHISAAPPPDRLIPTTTDPYETARCRVWADRVNRDCCSPYYGVLVRTDPDERARHFQHLLGGLRQFSRQLERTDGPLFLADRQLSSVDLALLPWAYRYYVLEHYRGPEFVIPKDASLDAYHEWFQHCLGLDSVKRTLPDKDRYLEHIEKYADSSARSKVANAVRRGVAAHELDDEKDEYNST